MCTPIVDADGDRKGAACTDITPTLIDSVFDSKEGNYLLKTYLGKASDTNYVISDDLTIVTTII